MNENNTPKPWKQLAFYHLLVWAVFISYELICIFATVGLGDNYLPYVVYYLLYITLFYCNAHVIMDFSFFRTKSPYLITVILILVEIAFFGMLKAVIDCLLTGGGESKLKAELFNRSYMLSNIFRQIFFIGFSIAYWSLLYLTRYRDRSQKLEIEQLTQKAEKLELENRYMSVENAYLQNQISPHLLFNSLNFIYYSVYQLSERAGKGIMLLSDLLRYSLTAGGTGQALVPLEQEIEQLHNLIDLDRMRFKEKRYLFFRQSGDVTGISMVPLVLLTLVENVIKHGDCGDPDSPAMVELTLDQNKLRFSTVNKKRENLNYENTGLGLVNLRKRLQNAYQSKFELLVNEEGDRFFTKLTIEQ